MVVFEFGVLEIEFELVNNQQQGGFESNLVGDFDTRAGANATAAAGGGSKASLLVTAHETLNAEYEFL